GKLKDTVQDQIKSELPRDLSRPGRWKAFCQWRSPQTRGSTNQSPAALKLLIKRSRTGQTRKQPRTSSTAAIMKWPVVSCSAGAFLATRSSSMEGDPSMGYRRAVSIVAGTNYFCRDTQIL